MCPCSFVVKLTNYNCVLAERIEKKHPTRTNQDADTARAYLNGALSLKESFEIDAANAYKQLQDKGKLSSGDAVGVSRAISHQATLATSNFMTHNPPGHGAKKQLKAQMQKVEHPKGPTWIRQHGQDVNLAVKGASRRVKNNRLQGVCELEDSDDDSVEVVDRKPAASKTLAGKRADSTIDPDVEKVKRLRKASQKSINSKKDFDDLSKKEKKEHERHMKAMKWYSKAIKDNSCKEVTGMLLDGNEE